MDTIYDFLSKYIRTYLKNNKSNKESILNYITERYYDEYKKNFSKTNNKEDALNETLSAFNKEYLVKTKTKKSIFALLLSLFSFLVEIIISFSAIFLDNLMITYGIIVATLLLIMILILTFMITTFKKRTLIDYIIFSLLLISIIVINIQSFIYFYRPFVDQVSYYLHYIFPGALIWKRYFDDVLNSSITLFDPTLITSFICLITSLVIYIIENKKEKKLSKNINVNNK